MHKIIRFWNQNRRGIITGIAAIALLIVIIQVLNQMAKVQKEEKNNKIVQLTEEEKKLPTQSIIGRGDTSIETTKSNVEIIEEFIKKCNNKDIEGAYSMLTDECKEELFTTKENFKKGYYDIIFNSKKIVNIENYISGDKRYTYRVTFYEDILATGKIDGAKEYQDYITIDEKYNNGKININSFIFKKEINKQTEVDGIKITIVSQKVYKENEEYEIKIENHTDKRILIDTREKNKSVYLVGSNNISYDSYISEISSILYEIPANFYRTYNIKFNKKYSSEGITSGIVFSDIVTDCEKYKQRPEEVKDRVKISVII